MREREKGEKEKKNDRAGGLYIFGPGVRQVGRKVERRGAGRYRES